MYINGDFDSEKARQIQIQLKRCVGHDYCKKEEEILTFFKNKWLLFLYNQKLFDSRFYGDEAVKSTAKLNWVSVNTQFQQQIQYQVTIKQLLLQDSDINLDEVTLNRDTTFTLDQIGWRSYES